MSNSPKIRLDLGRKLRRYGALIAAMIVVSLILTDFGESRAAGKQEAAACFQTTKAQDGSILERKYLLAPGDKLQINIYQREDLTGLHEIGEDGMISLPLLGWLQAAGQSVLALEKTVAATIEETTGRTEHVSIQMTARRPIYVVGLVNRPGSYPYATNMTVLHAIALSGGLYRPDVRVGGLVGLSRENARITESTLRLKQGLALQARLQAELTGNSKLTPPKRLVSLEGKNGAAQFMSRQVNIMQKRSEVRAKQLTGLKETAVLAHEEIKILKERDKLFADQLGLAGKELAATNKLKKQGLVNRSTLFTIHRVIAGLESDRRAVLARISRAGRDLLNLEQQIQLFDISQELILEESLNRAEIEIATTESAIRSSQWIVGELNTAASQGDEDAKPLTVSYQIIRSSGKRRHQFQADELTVLCPGDIVRAQPGILE